MRWRFFIVGACVALATQTAAQGTQVAFGVDNHDSELPIEVTSEQLDVDQALGRAVFTGDVLVGQGEFRLFGQTVTVFFEETGGDDGNRITRVLANGEVVLVSATETAEGDDAVYTVDDGVVVMTGNVILTQGPSVITGDTLNVNLNDGTGTMQGRVRTVFQSGPDQ